MPRPIRLPLILLLLVSLSCSFPVYLPLNLNQLGDESGPRLRQIFFAQAVTADGDPLQAQQVFPAGTKRVYLSFSFADMKKGQIWGVLVEHNERMIINHPKESWVGPSEGWIALPITEELSDISMGGAYKAALLLDEQIVQLAGFQVELPEITPGLEPSFGPAVFSSGLAREGIPLLPAVTFEARIKEVYATFAFSNLAPGQKVSREWLYNGATQLRTNGVWDDASNGVTYAKIRDADGLNSGRYTLNLYIDDKLVRSSSFDLGRVSFPRYIPTPTQPAPAPMPAEALVQPALMPAFEAIRKNKDTNQQIWANWLLNKRVLLRSDTAYFGLAAYRGICSTEQTVSQPDLAEITVSADFLTAASPVELAGVLVHEAAHAMQHAQRGSCGCTVEREYQAHLAQANFYLQAGQDKLVEQYLGAGLFDAQGNLKRNQLWAAMKTRYGDRCPEY